VRDLLNKLKMFALTHRDFKLFAWVAMSEPGGGSGGRDRADRGKDTVFWRDWEARVLRRDTLRPDLVRKIQRRASP
jgi:hypothetical protein